MQRSHKVTISNKEQIPATSTLIQLERLPPTKLPDSVRTPMQLFSRRLSGLSLLFGDVRALYSIFYGL